MTEEERKALVGKYLKEVNYRTPSGKALELYIIGRYSNSERVNRLIREWSEFAIELAQNRDLEFPENLKG